jgi:hypothetical protein
MLVVRLALAGELVDLSGGGIGTPDLDQYSNLGAHTTVTYLTPIIPALDKRGYCALTGSATGCG